MGYSNLADLQAGREAAFNAEADKRADLRADDKLKMREENIIAEENRINELEAAEARGIQAGSRAGKMDATRYFAKQGFIPRQVFGQAEGVFNMAEAQAEGEAGGLAINPEVVNDSVIIQAEDISTKLLQAAEQGAPNDQINQTLDKLNIPDSVKREAAKMFIQKSADVNGDRQSAPANPGLQGNAVERMNSPITRQAQAINQQTDSLIQRLHEKLAPPPPQEQA